MKKGGAGNEGFPTSSFLDVNISIIYHWIEFPFSTPCHFICIYYKLLNQIKWDFSARFKSFCQMVRHPFGIINLIFFTFLDPLVSIMKNTWQKSSHLGIYLWNGPRGILTVTGIDFLDLFYGKKFQWCNEKLYLLYWGCKFQVCRLCFDILRIFISKK